MGPVRHEAHETVLLLLKRRELLAWRSVHWLDECECVRNGAVPVGEELDLGDGEGWN